MTHDGLTQNFEFSACGQFVRRTIHLNDGVRHVRQFSVKPSGRGDDPCMVFDQAFLRATRSTQVKESTRPSVRIADLFSGCGGLSLGAREACIALGRRFQPCVAVDTDTKCLAVYARNLKCENALSDNISELIDGGLGAGKTRKEQLFLEKAGRIDILLAGPPCQGNSNLNNHTRREDVRNLLYERVARVVEIAKPSFVLIENLPTVVHGREGVVQNTVKLLQKLDYFVDSGVVPLAELGVPQRRMRHVVVASRLFDQKIETVISNHKVLQPRSTMWAIGDLRSETRNGIFSTPSNVSEENRSRIKYLHDHGVFDLPNSLRPVCHQNDHHSYWSMYGRMRPDEPAQTLTCGFASPGQGRYVHPTQRRTLTPHEAARLQFFPDFFDFSAVASRKALAKMIGNAVPMKLSFVFCLEFLARQGKRICRSSVNCNPEFNGSVPRK